VPSGLDLVIVSAVTVTVSAKPLKNVREEKDKVSEQLEKRNEIFDK
jgi:hypothetical protein